MTDEARMPGHGLKWNRRFLGLAAEVASWSKDPSTKVGAIIVRSDKTVAALGYNGFARGMADHAALYEDREKKLARVVHAEENAILSAAERLHGHTLYCTLLPCSHCALLIVQSGIKCVVAPTPSEAHEARWGAAFDLTRSILREANVTNMHEDGI